MLDNLIESRNQRRENKKFGGFMLSTAIVLVTILSVGFVFSLFNQNIVLAADSLEISTLVAPVQFEPKPEIKSEPKPQIENKVENNQSKVPTRTDNVLRVEENPTKIPDTVAVTPSNIKSRPNSDFTLDKVDFDPVNSGSPKGRGTSNNSVEGTGIVADNSNQIEKPKEEKTEELPPIIKPKEEKKITTISGGVVNGKARNLVTPSYPAAAKNIGAKGQVKVQVLIDENGNVVSANAVSGHPLLKSSAINAAKASKFTPTTLTGQRVKVTGIIVYNFT